MARKTQKSSPKITEPTPVRFDISHFKPITRSQSAAVRGWNNGNDLILSGYPGTGKTTLSTALALMDVLDPETPVDRVVIVRSAVQVREQGFVPGTLKEKQAIFETPHIDAINKLLDDKRGYHMMSMQNMVEFTTTSVQRSINIDNAVIIMDEAQNCTYHELKTVLTRAGVNSRFILCGDTGQNDLAQSRNRADISGMAQFVRVLERMGNFTQIKFGIEDIVRSDLVKNFIIAEEEILING